MFELQAQDDQGWVGIQSGPDYLAMLAERDDLAVFTSTPLRVELVTDLQAGPFSASLRGVL